MRKIILAGLVLIGVILRVVAADGDLWLDEIWSLDLAARAHSAWKILTGIHHDNNHYLNTLWLHLMGPARDGLLYRLPSVLAGSALVAMAAFGRATGSAQTARATHAGDTRHAFRAAWVQRAILTLFLALSHLFVLYSGEARGYATLVFFAFAAYLLLESYLDEPFPELIVLFNAVCLLGFLSHLSFGFAWVAFLLWFTAEAFLARAGVAFVLRQLAMLFAPVALFLAWLWWVDLRQLTIGGDAPSSWLSVAADTAGLLWFGAGGLAQSASWIALAATASAVFAGLWPLRWPKRVFFGTCIFALPAAAVALRSQHYLAPRYFLIPALFVAVLAADALARVIARGGWRRSLALLPLAVFAGANIGAMAGFVTDQRGHYQAALLTICGADRQAVIGGDHDFRNGLVVKHYIARTPGCERMEYVPMPEWPSRPPGFLILHSLERQKEAPTEITPEGLGRFALLGTFHSGEVSGWTWSVYRRQ